MDTRAQRQKRRDTTLSSLNAAIEVLHIAKDMLSMTPAKATLGSVTVILTMIRVSFILLQRCSRLLAETNLQDSMVNEGDYVDLGLACADVCKALDRGMNGRRVDQLSQSVFEAIGQLTM